MTAARIIPILPIELLAKPAPPPRLVGAPAELQRVLGGLEAAMLRELGARAPVPGWLRELRLDADEAYLAFTPELCAGDTEPAEVAFAALRRLLPDTDIYIGAAAA
jgi:hypothetical protein